MKYDNPNVKVWLHLDKIRKFLTKFIENV